jgi:hypothetical protein
MMMSTAFDNRWEEVEQAASKMFSVWTEGREREWAKEAWGHLHSAGLAGGNTALEITDANLQLVMLARIYEEFCGFAWDENPATPIEYLAEDLEIDPVALGILAAENQSVEFDGATDEHELREAALIAATEKHRAEIFECLKTACGGDIALYTRLSHTRSEENDVDGEEFEVTGSNSSALNYVLNGFQS